MIIGVDGPWQGVIWQRLCHPYASPESRYSNARNEKALSATWHGEVGRGLLGTLYAEYYRSLVPDPRRRSEQGRLFSARLDYRHRDFMATIRWRSTSRTKTNATA
ncbi:hypothetical protein [Porphyromonas cangingivalis]|uniref:hypothetical protein n=1 Tax=Porphyromonas cangingivalis TaxID=36874 RepID=UPI0011DDA206|nr:hypothetical protein [Porphyromonas cangingivalis]